MAKVVKTAKKIDGKKSKKELEEEDANTEVSAQEGEVVTEGAIMAGGFSVGTIALGTLALGGIAAAAGGGGGSSGAAAVAPSTPGESSDDGYLLATETATMAIPSIYGGTNYETYIAEHSYDANGYETKVTLGIDINDNLVLDELEVYESIKYTYNSDGKISRESFDSGDNGTIERVDIYHYDSDGNLVEKETDFSNDGDIDQVTTYEHNNDTCNTENFDFDNDGIIDQTIRYICDNNDNILSEFVYYKGILIESSSYAYEDNTLTINIDGGSDGTIDDVIVFEYDNNGNCLTRNEDWDNDGTIDVAYVYDYTQGTIPIDYEPNFVL